MYIVTQKSRKQFSNRELHWRSLHAKGILLNKFVDQSLEYFSAFITCSTQDTEHSSSLN